MSKIFKTNWIHNTKTLVDSLFGNLMTKIINEENNEDNITVFLPAYPRKLKILPT